MKLRGVLCISVVAAVFLLAACGGDDPSPTPVPTTVAAVVESPLAAPAEPDAGAGFVSPLSNQVEVHAEGEGDDHAHVAAATATDRVQVVLVPSELVIGPNRFAVGLLDAAG